MAASGGIRTSLYIPTAADFGWLGWTADPGQILVSTAAQPTNGKPYLTRARAYKSGTVNNLGFILSANGTALTANACFAGLYDSGQSVAGQATLLAVTADQSANWESTGPYYGVFALTSPAYVTAGQDYFFALLTNGTGTVPKFAATTTEALYATQMLNQGLSGLTQRTAQSTVSGATVSGAASLPSKITAAQFTSPGTSTSAANYVAQLLP